MKRGSRADGSRFGVAALSAALEHSFDGIWIYDAGGQVLYVNRAALEYNGVRLEDVLGRTWHQLWEQGVFLGSAARTAFQEKRTATEEILNNAGRHLLCTATPIFGADGTIDQVITNVRDITELFELTKTLNEQTSLIEGYRRELNAMRQQAGVPLVAESRQMRTLVGIADRVADTDATVLLLGESGVGKDVLARRIHSRSRRADREMVIANCGAIPSTLVESEFFGYEKGAFTGASGEKAGLFETADGGTLLLDEVGDLEPAMQVKLLRVLQEGKVRRLGGRREVAVDVRVVAATNRDVQSMVREGRFRADLFYRLNVIPIRIPPLRERPDDIRRLISSLLKRYNEKYGLRKTLSAELLHKLETYSWPGNIRELDNLMERLVLVCPDDIVTAAWLPPDMLTETDGEKIPEAASATDALTPLREATENAERRLLTTARRLLGDTRSMARVLGVSHVTVARKLRQYGIA